MSSINKKTLKLTRLDINGSSLPIALVNGCLPSVITNDYCGKEKQKKINYRVVNWCFDLLLSAKPKLNKYFKLFCLKN